MTPADTFAALQKLRQSPVESIVQAAGRTDHYKKESFGIVFLNPLHRQTPRRPAKQPYDDVEQDFDAKRLEPESGEWAEIKPG
jgi:hypothetical protein